MRAVLFLLAILLPALSGASVQLEGKLTQGGLIFGKTEPGARVQQDGEKVPVSPEGDFLIGFTRDAPPQSTLVIHYPDGRDEKRVLKISRRKFDIQRIDGLPPRKVTPRAEDLKRIKADRVAVRKARARVDERLDFLHGFDWPVKGRISGVYGSQRILNGKPKWPHYGVDIAGPVGTPVRAPADGIVTLAHPDMFYSGATLIMDHGHGLSSTFLHLSRILVKEGQVVKKGQIVAKMGASGRVTGPHLDWRMNLRGKRVDPQLIVGPMNSEQAENSQ
ncbi:M23 family metallopeptidase [Thiolapillus brandeum]|uniref:Peptidase M23 n=1 Tax=Thiolapillus brandeum TaxID=1076588 RepID=A0A7U6GK70_9GAMM|nr:M23 family metallopeptidase [Thiolapillus brandeum]BAO45123.1 peptidase M23 [Thiolapillus brandeum]